MDGLAVEPGLLLHYRIATALRGAIGGGRYQPGELLPSEQALMRSFGVSRGTVRRALLTLAQQGQVEPLHGRGTRVLDTPRATSRHMHGPVDDAGAMPEGMSIRLLSVDRDAGRDGAVRVRRLRVRGDMPFWLTTATMPGPIGGHFTDQDFACESLVALLARIGRGIVRTREEIGAIAADPDLAALLQVVPGTALIEYRRVLEDADGEDVCSHVNLIPPARHRIRLTLVAADHEGLCDELPDFTEYHRQTPAGDDDDR